MTPGRADLIIRGDVVVEAHRDRLEVVEAIGIAGAGVVSAGSFTDVSDAAARTARVVDARGHAVIPGLHDFHLHLVGMARARSGVDLAGCADGAEAAGRILDEAGRLAPDAWLIGHGWTERLLAGVDLTALGRRLGSRPSLLMSHDRHSAWASPAALQRAGIGPASPDPPGGRIERDRSGRPTGILRETALERVSSLVPPVRGESLAADLRAVLAEMTRHGITGASEAGDYNADGGAGRHAALGDSASTLLDLAGLVDGRLRLSVGIPADALDAASQAGLRTGWPVEGRETVRMGWAKEYADGSLGSGTAALAAPAGGAERGILRVTPEQLDSLIRSSRRAGIGLAVHAIGDRAVTVVLDALARAQRRPTGAPADRIEHLQLVAEADLARFGALGVTASVQPVHAAADRDLAESEWQSQIERAYAWRSLTDAGAHLAAGSDAPVETLNPWLGIFAAVHRRFPRDGRGDWRPAQALSVPEALRAYTVGPALSIGTPREGSLHPGARADLAILNVGLHVLLAADERLAGIHAEATYVDGREVRS